MVSAGGRSMSPCSSMRTWRAIASGDGLAVCVRWSLMVYQASWAMDTIRLAAVMPKLARPPGRTGSGVARSLVGRASPSTTEKTASGFSSAMPWIRLTATGSRRVCRVRSV